MRGEIRVGTRAIVTWTALAAVAAVCLIGLAIMWVFGVGVFSQATAETRGETGVREQTVASGQYRIAKYDMFHDRCNAIVALDGQIDDTQARLQGADATTRFYEQQNLIALRSQYREQAAAYNADASKEGTAGQFRDSALPHRIDPNPNGVTPSCA